MDYAGARADNLLMELRDEIMKRRGGILVHDGLTRRHQC